MKDGKFFVNLGKRISSLRRMKGLSVEEVAYKTGIRKSYLQQIEKGKAFGITTSHLFKIASVLNVPLIKIIKDL